MKLSKLIGWVLILTPFVLIAAASTVEFGLLPTLKMLGGVLVLLGMLVAGVELAHR